MKTDLEVIEEAIETFDSLKGDYRYALVDLAKVIEVSEYPSRILYEQKQNALAFRRQEIDKALTNLRALRDRMKENDNG